MAQTGSSWHAVDVSVAGVANHPRVLWQNDDGRVQLWTINNATGAVLNTYADGPYPGFTVKAVATGPDGNTRVLWVHPSGVLSFQIVNASGQPLSYQPYGPYLDNLGTGLPVDVAVIQTGTSNSTRVLWKRSDGAISVWTMDAAGNQLSYSTGGPWAGWDAKAIGVGTDGQSRILWNRTNGAISTTVSNVALSPELGTRYDSFSDGPGLNWHALDIAVGNDSAGDNRGRILWNRDDDMVSLWATSPAGVLAGYAHHGPWTGWKAKAVAVQIGGQSRILWNHASGAVSLFETQANGSYGSHFYYNLVPIDLIATGGPGRIALNWTARDHATGYNVYRANSISGSFIKIGSSASASYTDTSCAPNTTYFYKVKTDTVGVESEFSAVVTATPQPASALITSIDNEGTKLRVRWNHSNPPATTYTVWRSGTVNGSYASIGSSTTTNFLDMTTAPGLRYFYKVSNLSGGTQTLYSDAVGKMAAPVIPPNVRATTGAGSVFLQWDAAQGAKSYQVFRAAAIGGPYNFIGVPRPYPYYQSYYEQGLTNGQTYYYRVEAFNEEGNGSGQSLPLSATPGTVTGTPTPVPTVTPVATATPGPTVTPTPGPGFGAPQNLVATGKYKKIELRWDAVTSATSYLIQRRTAGGFFANLTMVNAPTTTYTDADSSLVIGTAYYYQVRAIRSGQQSAFSNEANATPLPPFVIRKLDNGDVLGGYGSVDLFVYTPIDADDIKLLVDGNLVSQAYSGFLGDGQTTLASLPIRTERFANGTHTIKVVHRSGYAQTRTVTFSNDVFNLKYDSIFDSGNSSSSTRIRAQLVSSQNWAVKIKDYGGIVVKTFSGMGSIVDVNWDGTNNASVSLRDATYAFTISPLGTSANVAQGSFVKAESPITANISKKSNRTVLSLPTEGKDRSYNTNWQAVIRGSLGNTIKTLNVERINTSRAAVIWDGTDESGENMPNGYYSVTFTKLRKGNRTSLVEGFGARDVGGAGHDLADCPIVKDHYKDSLIILDLAALNSNMSVAMEYAQFIESRINARATILDDAPSVMIVDTNGAALNSSGIGGNSQVNPGSAVEWIDLRLKSTPLKLFYVDSHGGVGTSGFLLPEQNPFFGIGAHQWFSKNIPDGHALKGLATTHELPTMLANHSYGQNADPPRLVWIDTCDSFGGDFDPITNQPQQDNGFAQAFGIIAAIGNGYSEGVALGWFGQAAQYGTDSTWTAWRRQFWEQMFPGGKNFQTALNRTNSLTPTNGATSPHYRYVYSGIETTSF